MSDTDLELIKFAAFFELLLSEHRDEVPHATCEMCRTGELYLKALTEEVKELPVESD